MVLFSIRSRRIDVELPVKVFLQRKAGGRLSTQYSDGTLVNVSRDGACLIFHRVLLEDGHMFFAAQPETQHFLHLTDLPEEGPVDHLQAETEWMDQCMFKGRPSFKIGISFIDEQKELYSFLKKHKRHSGQKPSQ